LNSTEVSCGKFSRRDPTVILTFSAFCRNSGGPGLSVRSCKFSNHFGHTHPPQLFEYLNTQRPNVKQWRSVDEVIGGTWHNAQSVDLHVRGRIRSAAACQAGCCRRSVRRTELSAGAAGKRTPSQIGGRHERHGNGEGAPSWPPTTRVVLIQWPDTRWNTCCSPPGFVALGLQPRLTRLIP